MLAKLENRKQNLVEKYERFKEQPFMVSGTLNTNKPVTNTANFCDKGWSNGDFKTYISH